MHAYTFRPFERADLPLVHRWLHAPQNVRWWGDPEVEFESLEEDLDEPKMRQWIVACDGRDFAYVQAYAIASWPQAHLMHLPQGAVAVDTFVGEPDMLGRGHGGAYLEVFARMLLDDGAPLVAIDPSADNLRARQAYARAGFTGDRVVEHGGVPVVVMTFARQPELTTHRLRLAPLTSEHASTMFEALQDPGLYRYTSDEPPPSLDALRERYRRLESRRSPDGTERWFNWVIVLQGAPDEPLGYVQATVREASAFIAYVLFGIAQGRGFAVEAADKVIDYLTTCGVAEVRAEIDVRNVASQRVAEKLGLIRIPTESRTREDASIARSTVYAKSVQRVKRARGRRADRKERP